MLQSSFAIYISVSARRSRMYSRPQKLFTGNLRERAFICRFEPRASWRTRAAGKKNARLKRRSWFTLNNIHFWDTPDLSELRVERCICARCAAAEICKGFRLSCAYHPFYLRRISIYIRLCEWLLRFGCRALRASNGVSRNSSWWICVLAIHFDGPCRHLDEGEFTTNWEIGKIV